jgi:hypothetical protein
VLWGFFKLGTFNSRVSRGSFTLGSLFASRRHLLYGGARFENPQRPGDTEHDRASLYASLGGILVVVVEEENEILRGSNVIGLTPIQ